MDVDKSIKSTKQINEQTDRQTDRQIDRETDRKINRWKGRQADRWTDKLATNNFQKQNSPVGDRRQRDMDQ